MLFACCGQISAKAIALKKYATEYTRNTFDKALLMLVQ